MLTIAAAIELIIYKSAGLQATLAYVPFTMTKPKTPALTFALCSCLVHLSAEHRQAAGVHRCLGQHTIDGRQPQQAAYEGHKAQEQQVVVVRRRLGQVEFLLLSHFGGYVVVEIEQDGDDDRWKKSRGNPPAGIVPALACCTGTMADRLEPDIITNTRHT